MVSFVQESPISGLLFPAPFDFILTWETFNPLKLILTKQQSSTRLLFLVISNQALTTNGLDIIITSVLLHLYITCLVSKSII